MGMSEHTPPREQRMVHVLRPRFDISPTTREEIMEFVVPSKGTPELLGVYATRTVALDAGAYHANAYGRTLNEQAKKFSETHALIQFGIARTSRNQNLKLPPVLSFKDDGKGSVYVALRPRQTNYNNLDAVLSILNFDEYENNETLRPYYDTTPEAGNYLFTRIANAALKASTSSYRRADAIRAFTEAAADTSRSGRDYYATPLEIEGRDIMMSVPVRPLAA
jgi:hypothetical protein